MTPSNHTLQHYCANVCPGVRLFSNLSNRMMYVEFIGILGRSGAARLLPELPSWSAIELGTCPTDSCESNKYLVVGSPEEGTKKKIKSNDGGRILAAGD